MAIVVRAGSAEDGVAIREIERRAGERYRDVGLPEVAEQEPPSIEVLARYAIDGRSWVALDDAGDGIGYVLVDIVDANAHIEQVSVRPDRQGAGVGRALIECVRTWATEMGIAALTLTTFTDVPWNAALYRHLGFRVLGEEEIGPELGAVRAKEAAHGLDPATRVCMRREVSK